MKRRCIEVDLLIRYLPLFPSFLASRSARKKELCRSGTLAATDTLMLFFFDCYQIRIDFHFAQYTFDCRCLFAMSVQVTNNERRQGVLCLVPRGPVAL